MAQELYLTRPTLPRSTLYCEICNGQRKYNKISERAIACTECSTPKSCIVISKSEPNFNKIIPSNISDSVCMVCKINKSEYNAAYFNYADNGMKILHCLDTTISTCGQCHSDICTDSPHMACRISESMKSILKNGFAKI